MGGEAFTEHATGKTAQEAFKQAVESALYDYGHAGYTGTIAEKGSFVMIDLPEDMDAEKYAWQLIDDDDKRISDKWGDAGCLKVSEDEFMFFGWASS